MTPEAQKRYDEKVSRVEAAIALKEPDRVPMMPSAAAAKKLAPRAAF